ncbi:MAG: hypothetical protein BM557_00775 [Flavobacterium sp. MedPE-SWcel]|uniref:hypothetical protein n=1 Tax=uncultured Flavobacterium sp. TaxID=165435 RepID=UPI00091E1D2C|nr:hypothetical protein [uncultured Flavobacterium sp.]OIQ22553.1 MAG: hypothetical protein BM557_00775 [Flavobacterium sp. MedPE-SWcel]
MNKLLLLVFTLISLSVFSQEERQSLSGRVQVEGAGLDGVFVINTTAAIEVKTSASGNFTIAAQPGDAIAVYSSKITAREFKLNKESFVNQPLLITVSLQSYELEGVTLEKNRVIDEVSLGLVPADQKQYTAAEKRLFTATSGILEPLINAITGRTKMLKKALEIEKKRMLLEDIQYLYSDEEVIEEFKVPREYVDGLWYYVVEDTEFIIAFKNNDEGAARLLMYGLAEEYLKLINDE